MVHRPDLKEIVGETIFRLRESHGLTQLELAKAAGISEPTMIRIEKGRAATNLDIIERIAKQLGVAPATLFAPGKAPAAAETPPVLAAELSEKNYDAHRKLTEAPIPGLSRLIEELEKLSQGQAAKFVESFLEILCPDTKKSIVQKHELPKKPTKR